MQPTRIVGSICTPEEFDDNLKIDFSKYTRKKGSIDYVPWAELVRTLHKKVPNCTYGFKEGPDGSMIFYTPEKNAYLRPYLIRRYMKEGEVTLEVMSPPGFFPISNMRARHAAIIGPNIRDIDNCLRRAIAKEIGVMTGIGLQLWAADDPYDLVDEEEPCEEPTKRSSATTASTSGSNGSSVKERGVSASVGRSEGSKPLDLDKAAEAAGLDEHGKQTIAKAVRADSWASIPDEKAPKIIQTLANPDNIKLLNAGKNTQGKTINPKTMEQEMEELAAAFKASA